MGTLAGGISCGFNNMLQAVSGYAQIMLLGRWLEASQERYLQGMLRACTALTTWSTSFCTFSRRGQPSTQRLDLN